MEIREQLSRFEPEIFSNREQQESSLKAQMLRLLECEGSHPLYREREEAHFTASSMILNPEGNKALMVYHNIYQSISWTGGHADGEEDLMAVALREAREETGITKIWPCYGGILALDLLPVPTHTKRGRRVEAHLHFSVAYGFIAPEDQPLFVKEDENSAVEWICLEDLFHLCREPHMLPVYRKLLERMQEVGEWKRRNFFRLPESLLVWYRENARPLPWRKDREPYHVWLSEIMLQQTRAEAVKGYYNKFLKQLPDVSTLAKADSQQLMKLWEGLGYYNRARNLQKAARVITEEYGGAFPRDYDALLALPGVGEYTAGAVASICFGMARPAVDGNVLRVTARISENFGNVLAAPVKKAVTEALREVYLWNETEGGDNGTLTQSLMELGAVVCIPNGQPRCEICPCSDFCLSFYNGTQNLLPVREKKKERRKEEKTVFFLDWEGKLAVRKRPHKGLLAGLWELPHTEGFLSEEQALKQVEAWGIPAGSLEKSVKRQHIFTHVQWDMLCYYIKVRGGCEQQGFLWAEKTQLEEEIPLPTAFKQFL